MFSKDTVIISPSSGDVMPQRRILPTCNQGELLTGFTVKTENKQPWDTVNTINTFVCTDVVTGNKRTLGGDNWAGWNNAGVSKTLQCPGGSYISAVSGNWRGYGDRGRVTTGIGITCKDLNGKQTYSEQAGLGVLFPTSCPTNYFVNKLDLTSDKYLHSIEGQCIDTRPRIQVLAGTPTTIACCTGAGDPTICGDYTPQSGKCDTFFANFCKANPANPNCGCFNVPEGIPPCYAAGCLNSGYMTNNMKTSCPSQYINCDAQLVASNTGTQLAAGYTLQQNCGRGTSTSSSDSSNNTGPNTQPVPVNTTSIYMNLFIIFLIFVILFGGYLTYKYTSLFEFNRSTTI